MDGKSAEPVPAKAAVTLETQLGKITVKLIHKVFVEKFSK